MSQHEMLVSVIGMFASVISFVLWIPQATLVWRERNNPIALIGVSPVTQILVLCNATLWGVYAILTSAFWAGAPGIINAPLAASTLVILYRGRKIRKVCRCGWDDVTEHRIFIISPPGYGSVMPCSDATYRYGYPVIHPAKEAAS